MTEEQDTDAKLDEDDEEVFIDDEAEELNCNDLASEEGLDEDLKDLIDAFLKDDTMDQQIDDLFAEMEQDGVIDFTQNKGKILLLLQAYLSRVSGLNSAKAKKLLKGREGAISQHIQGLDSYFRNHKLSMKSERKTVFSKIKNRFFNMSDQAKKDFRNMVKRFAIYEVYQAVNPRRIAGETGVTNFVHNMIIGGFKRAAKYTGGKANDLKRYDKNFILRLQKLHNQLSQEKSEINVSDITSPSTPLGKVIDKQKGRGLF